MRRPHVYERSAPRPSRNAYHEPLGDRAAAARDIAGALPGLLSKAEAAGFPALAGLLHRALQEADLQARSVLAPAVRASSPIDDEVSSRADVEGLLRVLDASTIVAQPDV